MAEEAPKGKLAKAMEHQRAIYVRLAAWAQDPDAAFPDEPLDANANFRVLFQKRLMDNEKIFGICPREIPCGSDWRRQDGTNCPRLVPG